MVTKLETAIADIERDLDAARAAGDDKRVKELEDNLASRQSFLDMARQVSADYQLTAPVEPLRARRRGARRQRLPTSHDCAGRTPTGGQLDVATG